MSLSLSISCLEVEVLRPHLQIRARTSRIPHDKNRRKGNRGACRPINDVLQCPERPASNQNSVTQIPCVTPALLDHRIRNRQESLWELSGQGSGGQFLLLLNSESLPAIEGVKRQNFHTLEPAIHLPYCSKVGGTLVSCSSLLKSGRLGSPGQNLNHSVMRS